MLLHLYSSLLQKCSFYFCNYSSSPNDLIFHSPFASLSFLPLLSSHVPKDVSCFSSFYFVLSFECFFCSFSLCSPRYNIEMHLTWIDLIWQRLIIRSLCLILPSEEATIVLSRCSSTGFELLEPFGFAPRPMLLQLEYETPMLPPSFPSTLHFQIPGLALMHGPHY